jgi:hypothetical protein
MDKKEEMMRKEYLLTDNEFGTFRKLGSYPEEGFDFWRGAAKARNLDYKTIIGNTTNQRAFTALTVGHGKHWCFPLPLNVKGVVTNGKAQA